MEDNTIVPFSSDDELNEKKLFEAVRAEDVTLWIGAGFSLYAGYPTGLDLANRLFNMLPSTHQDRLNENSLQEVAQVFVDLNGRNQLMAVLRDEFGLAPKSNKYHATLAKIPHIKSIITTNFDTMLESAYGDKGQWLYDDFQTPNINKTRTQIFKIHGDLSVADSIVITSDDYTKFFAREKERSNMWSILRDRIATKSQLFIGYNLSDINVTTLLEKTWNTIRDERKDCYFIAPNIPEHRRDYLKNRGITYINAGEEFVERLYQNILENILKDFDKGILGAEVFRSFLYERRIKPTITPDGNRYKLDALKGIDGAIEGTISFTFKKGTEVLRDFNDLVDGNSFDKVTIPADALNEASCKLEGIPLFDGVNELVNFHFIAQPSFELLAEIRFETGYEMTSIPVKVFRSSKMIELFIDLKQGILRAKMPDPKESPNLELNVQLVQNDFIKSVKDGIDYYSFVENLFSGKQFSVFLQDGGKLINKRLSSNTPRAGNATANLDYFHCLKKIEQHFNIRFENISLDDINEENHALLKKIVKAVIKREGLETSFDSDLSATFDEISEEDIVRYEAESLVKNDGMFYQEKILSYETIHNVEICLGYKRWQFPSLILLNKDELLQKQTKTGRFISAEKKKILSYLQQLPPENAVA